ncbi:MAG TPA: Ig-like domain-containing protein [Chitinispirillaceae bacterium]|nr:Ig-like domain-containing protein [Chitinispirillaceae bacterium]
MSSSAGKLFSLETNYHLYHFLKNGYRCVFFLLFCIFTLQAQVILYSEGFETTDGGFVRSGTPDSWQWGTPSPSFTLGPATANSGLRCWGTNLDGDIPMNSNTSITSPSMTLPTVTSNQVMRVRFFGWLAIDYMNDRGEFLISRDSVTWSTLGGFFCTMQGGWNEYYFDITSYAGSKVWLRFRCYTDGSNTFYPPTIPVNNAGFYIDDIAITLTDAPSEKTILTFEGYENTFASGASCPWIYTWNGSSYVKDNDIYSTARGKNKEYKDYYLLQKPLVASGNFYKLQIAETDDEESYTDLAQLIVVDHDPTVKIAHDENGNIFSYGIPTKPLTAIDQNNKDVLAMIAFEDSNGFPAHHNEYIDLDFNFSDSVSAAIFVLRAKGFLIDSAGEGAGTLAKPRILVQTQVEDGDWVTRNVFYPRVESAVCAYDLKGLFTYSKKVRLLSVSCHWGKYNLIDYAGLDTASHKKLSVTPLSPQSAVSSIGENVLTRISSSDNKYVHMASSDIIFLEFDKPDLNDSMKRDFVFVSKGYYIPTGTFFFYTWDGTKWVQRDGWSISISTDSTRKFDLSLWLPDPDGEYKVRIWQDYIYNRAGIDYVGLDRGTTTGTMVSATDLRTSTDILNLVDSSDDVKLAYSSESSKQRKRWVEVRWTGLSTNMPPTTNPVTITNQNSSTPQINWTYNDREGNAQVQYEVEVWTSANGMGSNMWDPAVGNGSASSVIYAGFPLTGGMTYYARVKAFDGISWGGWSETSWTFPLNDLLPIAEAGSDQSIKANTSCQASVTLDGTGSNDPDGGAIVKYTWSGPGGPWTGATPVVTLPLGRNKITLTVVDNEGSSATDTVIVTVIDSLAPVPETESLPVVKGECSVTVSDTPKALDNCKGMITATTSDSLTFSTQGTHLIRWVYDDGNGNIANQVQTVIIDDTTKPVPEIATLPILRSDCSVKLESPFAIDNCKGRIAGTTTSSLTINNQGTFTIVWSYDDGNGNVFNQNQTVIIKDSIAPVFIKGGSDTVVAVKASISSAVLYLDSATASDNCSPVTISAYRSDGLPLDTSFFEGITRVTWKACDTSGNCDSVTRSVKVIRNRAPVMSIPADTSILEGQSLTLQVLASDSDGTVPEIFIDSCPFPFLFTDNRNGTATIEFRPGCSDNGVYNILFYATDRVDTVRQIFKLTIVDVNFKPVFDTTSYYVAREMQQFSAIIRVYDCDGTVPDIRIKNPPQGAVFTDNRNGTASLIWTPDADDNGYYIVIFEANDEITTIKDTIIIEVKDTNAWPPTLILSTTDTTCAFKLPLIIYARAEDLDGTPPVLKATGLPAGSSFEADEGNGIFKWLPMDTGVFVVTVTAFDQVDSTSFVSKTVTIRVTDDNVSGPVFDPQPEIVINQNQRMELQIKATDPDGTIPQLLLGSKPQDATFRDNNDGTGTITWTPDCDISGKIAFTAIATDGQFADTLVITATVNDVNCAPVLYKIPDINTMPGEFVKFQIEAYDPDNKNSTLIFSVSCDLPGYAFETSDNNTGFFSWYVNYSSGSFPVKFYVTDGLLTDSTEMRINIGKNGSVKISGYPSGARIYVMPSGSYSGEYLGSDSVIFTTIPGTYSFQMQLEGYRPQRFSCRVMADSVITTSRTLKTSIPLMLTPAETLMVQSDGSTFSGSFSLNDLNGDGVLDISSLNEKGMTAYLGTDTASLSFRASKTPVTGSVNIVNPFYHLFVDWNNDRKYDCLYSDRFGNINIVNIKKQLVDTILKLPNTSSYPVVFDINKDFKKDLLVHCETKGLFVYLNTGSDSIPVFGSPTQCLDSSGAPLNSMQGPFVLVDIDGDAAEEFIIRQNGFLRIFKINSLWDKLGSAEDLNCAGKKYTADSSGIFMIRNTSGMPGLILRNANKLLIYNTRLRGDINGDKTVNIRDITDISRRWEMIDTDLNWNPLCNLILSTTGNEVINIRDISRASRYWELKE